MSRKRIQLTLFVDEMESAAIEAVRRTYNPVQYGLIRAHVTLCREDELVDMRTVMSNLKELPPLSLVIRFGRPVRFLDGKGEDAVAGEIGV